MKRILLPPLMLLFIFGCSEVVDNSGKSDKITLSYAFFAPHNSFPAIQMEHWAEELEERTDGQVEVELFPGGTLLTAENMFDGVSIGTADIGMTATSYEPNQYPLLKISDLPSGFPNSTVSSQVVNELVKEFPPESLDEFEIIAVLTTEPAYIQVRNNVESLSEIENMNLRIAGSVSEIADKLKVSPVGMSQAEVAESLETGIIDGYITSREVLKDFSLAENIDTVIDYPLHTTTFISVMNKGVWESLPSDIQEVIKELRDEMSLFSGNYHDNQITESVDWSQTEHDTNFIQLSEEEENELESIMSGLQKDYVDELEQEGLPAEEYYDRLHELLEDFK